MIIVRSLPVPPARGVPDSPGRYPNGATIHAGFACRGVSGAIDDSLQPTQVTRANRRHLAPYPWSHSLPFLTPCRQSALCPLPHVMAEPHLGVPSLATQRGRSCGDSPSSFTSLRKNVQKVITGWPCPRAELLTDSRERLSKQVPFRSGILTRSPRDLCFASERRRARECSLY